MEHTGHRYEAPRPPSGVGLVVGVLLSLVLGFSALVWVQGQILDSWARRELTGLRASGEAGIIRELRGRVDSAHSVAQTFARSGRPPEEAKALALEAISSLRFDEDNYVWVHQLQRDDPGRAFMLVHAASDLEGHDVSGLIDLDELQSLYLDGHVYPKDDPAVADIAPTEIFRECNQLVLSQGSGVVRYFWPKVIHGHRTRVGYQKISYVRLLEPWDWVIGSGAYADEVDAVVAKRRAELLERERSIQRRVAGSAALLGLGILTLVLALLLISVRAQRGITEVLRESERRYRGIFESVGEALLVIEPHTWSILDANQPALVLYGREREEFVGESALDVGDAEPPWDSDTLKAHLDHALEVGKADFRWRAFRGPGDYFWADVAIRRTELAGLPRLLASVWDITERQEREDELRRVEAGIRGATDAIGMVDPSGRHFYQNPAFERLFGYDLDEVRRLGPETLYESTAVADEVFGAVLHRRSWRGEVRMRHKDGHLIDVLLRADPVFDARGELLAAVGLHSDITEAKASKAALERALAEAHAAAEAKGRFLANMSHEIRTPMNGALGMLQLLLDTELDPEQRELAQTAHQSASSLLGVVDDVLDYSRIESGRLALELISFPLREVLDAVAVLSGRAATRKGLLYLTLVSSGVPTHLVGDPGRLRQVLLNLASNAVKFTESGRVEVRVSLAAEGLRFEVVDTGVGLDTERVPELLQPFTQEDASTTRRFGGTGLGLAISSGLVEAMGGTLQAEGQPGKGARFWFTVDLPPSPSWEPPPLEGLRVRLVEPDPLRGREVLGLLAALGCEVVDAGEEVLLRATPTGYQAGERRVERPLVLGSMLRCLGGTVPSTPRQAPLARWPDRSVLLVEDNAVNRRLVVRLLERRGVRVSVAEDGAEALELEGDWDLVLMDCQMPRVDGYEASRRLRERGFDRPIVALTAHALPGDRERCLASGMDDHLAKPLQPGTLDATLRRWLGPPSGR